MQGQPELRLAPEGATRWDWWPLVRLLTVLSVFGAIAHYHFGWQVAATEVLALPRRVFEVLSFFALLSFGLAHLYLILLMFPLYAVVTLNDALYDASSWAARTLLGIRPPILVSLSGLCGEVVLFGALCFSARLVFSVF